MTEKVKGAKSKQDPEMAAIRRCQSALKTLTPKGRLRVITFVAQRFHEEAEDEERARFDKSVGLRTLTPTEADPRRSIGVPSASLGLGNG